MKAISMALLTPTLLLGPMAANAQLTPVSQDGNLMASDATLNVTWADLASPTDLTGFATAAAGSAQA